MRLEDQVCSLDLAKKLKKLGVKQESAFYWSKEGNVFQPLDPELNPYTVCAAFSVAELGELLPPMVGERHLTVHRFMCWWVCYESVAGTWIHFEATTEADARAKMLIHLIEKGIVSGLKAEGREVER